MAQNDIWKKVPTSTSDGSYCSFQPSAGVEIVIHNFGYTGPMELEYYDGTNAVKMDEDPTPGSRMNVSLHCTNTEYYRVKNVIGTAAAIYVCADGIVTK